MSIANLATLILSSVIFAVLGYVVARSRAAAAAACLQQQIVHLEEQFRATEATLASRQTELEQARSEQRDLSTKLALTEQRYASAEEQASQHEASARGRQEKLEKLQAELSEREQVLSSTRARLQSAQEQAEQQEARYQKLEKELLEQRQKAEALEERRADLAQELATLRTSQKDKEKYFAQQLKQLEDNKVALTREFENLANKIFESKGKAFTEQSRQTLDSMLNPFKQQINDFKAKVENVHLEGTKQQSELKNELKNLQNMHQKLSTEASDLATALKGQKKMQGNWGELVLENVLERSGLQLNRDYKREVSLVTEDGGRSRPDVVVYLPEGKHLIIDAKVSLNAYTRYVNAEDDLGRQQALAEHAHAFSARIKELADRDYDKLLGINSPETVIMFVPIESAFVEALKADETLFQKAIERNVLVATPTTLLTSLNIVRQLWRFENQNKHTAELASKAEGVFKKLRTFLGSFEAVKGGLDKAQQAYLKAERQLLDGPGNLVKQVNDFKALAPAIRGELPAYFTEKAELEISLVDHGANESKAKAG